VVEASPFLDEIRRADFDVMPVQEATAVRILPDEALSQLPPALDGLGPETAAWAALRLHAHDDHARFQGHTGPHSQSSYSISSLERYLDCPFKYFATHVLRLREDPDDDALSAPKARGRFVHDVFRRFFEAWHASGQRAITPETIGAARRLFREIVDQAVRSLPEAEAALERMRLVGSLVSPGFGEIVLRAELEDPRSVVERFLEIPLESQVEVPSGDGARTVTLRGVADRIDLLADGTFRLVDYKLGRAPDLKQAIQLPMYALFARAHLTAITGTSWQPSSAMYLALGGKQHVAPLTAKDEWDEALESGRTRCIEALAGIERGEFPPRPQEPFYCGFCPYSGVCRKDYVDVE
jgi:RecB family exonuclease